MLDNMKRQFAEHLFNLKFLSSKDVRHKGANVNSRNEDLGCNSIDILNLGYIRDFRDKFVDNLSTLAVQFQTCPRTPNMITIRGQIWGPP